MPKDLINSSVGPDKFAENVIMVSKELSENYAKFKQSIWNGSFGKSAQLWLIHLDLMEHQLRIYRTFQEKKLYWKNQGVFSIIFFYKEQNELCQICLILCSEHEVYQSFISWP